MHRPTFEQDPLHGRDITATPALGPEVGDTGKPSDPPLVLVVVDDAPTRALLAAALTATGLDVVEAARSVQALELIAHSGSFDAVVLEDHMAGPSGMEVLRRLRSQRETATLPVILMTADNQVADRVRSLQAGANDYIVKPSDVDELVGRVKAQLRWQTLWAEGIDRHDRERAAVAGALAQLTPEATAPRWRVRCASRWTPWITSPARVSWPFCPPTSSCPLPPSALPFGTYPLTASPCPRPWRDISRPEQPRDLGSSTSRAKEPRTSSADRRQSWPPWPAPPSPWRTRTGCRLIAEGIEIPAELDVLRGFGVELGQGFLLGRPVRAPQGYHERAG